MGQRWKSISGAMGTEIPVIVQSDQFGLQKAFKMSTSQTFREVLELFLEKSHQVVLSRFYALCLNMGTQKGQMLNLDDPLDAFPLPTPVCSSLLPHTELGSDCHLVGTFAMHTSATTDSSGLQRRCKHPPARV